MKDQELRKAAEKATDIDGLDWENVYAREKFIEGAKWQQERMYSEEDVMNALHSVELKYNRDFSKIYEGVKEWFEQFKKK